jgi:hypothetical protein
MKQTVFDLDEVRPAVCGRGAPEREWKAHAISEKIRGYPPGNIQILESPTSN